MGFCGLRQSWSPELPSVRISILGITLSAFSSNLSGTKITMRLRTWARAVSFPPPPLLRRAPARRAQLARESTVGQFTARE